MIPGGGAAHRKKNMTSSDSSTRAIVLAAGRGTRLRHITRTLGGPQDKQFCRFGRRRSLLQQTVHRLGQLAEATIVVVCRSQIAQGSAQLEGMPAVTLAHQPCDRGTGIGLLVGLLRAQTDDLVLIAPSDHAFGDEHVAQATLGRALSAARRLDSVVLVGATAHAPRSDYGWIVPDGGDALPSPSVRRFVEKPSIAEARRLMRCGGLFSTMMVAAPVGLLTERFEQLCPAAVRALRSSDGDDEAFAKLEPVDFSRDVLERCSALRVVSLPRRAGWTDLGDEQRLLEWLAAQGEHGIHDRVRRAARRGAVPPFRRIAASTPTRSTAATE
jgi:mannose-1-phosphate guanylyltransferase